MFLNPIIPETDEVFVVETVQCIDKRTVTAGQVTQQPIDFYKAERDWNNMPYQGKGTVEHIILFLQTSLAFYL